MGRQLTETTSFNGERYTTANTYDTKAQIKTITAPDGGITAYEYDALGRNVKITVADGTYSLSEYNAIELAASVNRAGKRTTYQLDALGRFVAQTDPKGQTTSFMLSPAGDRLALVDANGNRTIWDYNAKGQPIKKTYADGSYYEYTYNNLGRLTSRIDAKEQTTSYEYDSKGKLSKIDYPNDPDVTFSYDDFGRRVSMTDACGTTTWTYDKDKISTEDGPFDTTIVYSYDALGRKTALSLDGSTLSSYNVDPLGRLATVTTERSGSVQASFSYTYDNVTRRVKTMTRNGYPVVQNYSDILGRLTRKINLAPDGSIISGIEYVLNDTDERIKATCEDGTYHDYSYDLTEQLIGAVKKGVSGNVMFTYGYNYDPMGNRLSAQEDGRATSYNSNELNQSSIYSPSEMPTTPKYDANGNTLLSDPNGFIYDWNDENWLAVATKKTTKIEFVYDGLGRRRIKKSYLWTGNDWALDKEVKFVYDNWNLIEELDGNNLPLRTYTWGIDISGSEQGAGGVGGLLATASGNMIYYPNYDGNGNITSYVDNNGTQVDKLVYSPFGKIVSGSLSVCPFGFSSKYMDDETELVYYGYRYYDSENGRWLNRDPMEEDGGINLYCMTGNNTINDWDYLGQAASLPFTVIVNLLKNIMNAMVGPGDLNVTNYSFYGPAACTPPKQLYVIKETDYIREVTVSILYMSRSAIIFHKIAQWTDCLCPDEVGEWQSRTVYSGNDRKPQYMGKYGGLNAYKSETSSSTWRWRSPASGPELPSYSPYVEIIPES